ncbi:MAG TPA: hypothetical protein VM050_04650 [Patescibacteria group bacterium]|nr:hypothetical protein [Patescibacteria group bacterium]
MSGYEGLTIPELEEKIAQLSKTMKELERANEELNKEFEEESEENRQHALELDRLYQNIHYMSQQENE